MLVFTCSKYFVFRKQIILLLEFFQRKSGSLTVCPPAVLSIMVLKIKVGVGVCTPSPKSRWVYPSTQIYSLSRCTPSPKSRWVYPSNQVYILNCAWGMDGWKLLEWLHFNCQNVHWFVIEPQTNKTTHNNGSEFYDKNSFGKH